VRRMLESMLNAWRERASAARTPRPPRVAEPRLDRSRAGAALEARAAVRAGVGLEDFLRHRMARYAARLPVALDALPVTIEIEGGEPVVRARPRHSGSGALGASLGARTGEPRWLSALLEREGAGAVAEIRDAEEAVAALGVRAAAAQARIDEVGRALAEDLAEGRVTAPVEIDATAEQLGRCPVPPPWLALLLRAFAVALLGGETWRLAGPVLAGVGLSADELPSALQQAPISAGLALAFALGASGAVFALLAVGVRRAAELMAESGARGRPALVAVAMLAAGGLAAAVAGVAGAPTHWAEAMLLVAVPLAAVLALRDAARRAELRDAAEAEALAWDRERTRELVERARRAGVVGEAERALQRIETERVEARRRLRALERRAIEAHQAEEGAAQSEATRLERLSEALVGALELDRYVYLRHAAAHDAHAPAIRLERSVRLEPAGGSERLGVVG
jgi:hypothetical protein